METGIGYKMTWEVPVVRYVRFESIVSLFCIYISPLFRVYLPFVMLPFFLFELKTLHPILNSNKFSLVKETWKNHAHSRCLDSSVLNTMKYKENPFILAPRKAF